MGAVLSAGRGEEGAGQGQERRGEGGWEGGGGREGEGHQATCGGGCGGAVTRQEEGEGVGA
jgi:hypothetical protein